MMEFESDEEKNQTTIIQRDVSFEFATQVFADVEAVVTEDTRKDYGERRFVIIGRIEGKVYSVVYTNPRPNVTRIINARLASRIERRKFNALNEE